MKRLIIVFVLPVLCAFMVNSAFAAGQGHRNTGCGLGTLLWEGRADNSALLQALESCTNTNPTFFFNQSFGITSGTSRCERAAKFAENDRLNEFVVANMDNLAKDIAMGRGETLDTFAELMQVPVEKRAAFRQKLQANFSKIYSSENIQLANVVDNVAAVSTAK